MIKKQDIIWRKVKYLQIPFTEQFEYELWLNEPLASWDVYGNWEKERVHHMRKTLNKDEVLYDIGAEMGWLSLVYASMVNPNNVVLIEPTKQFWPNIKALWEKNLDTEPLACYFGLFSDKTTSLDNILEPRLWPKETEEDLIEKLAYTYIHENTQKVPEITLDDYVKQTGLFPNAITMDTEGSELLILKGAENTLRTRNLKVWVSVHPDLSWRDYKIKDQEVHDYMKSLGYKGTWLATDHEMHYFFSKS